MRSTTMMVLACLALPACAASHHRPASLPGEALAGDGQRVAVARRTSAPETRVSDDPRVDERAGPGGLAPDPGDGDVELCRHVRAVLVGDGGLAFAARHVSLVAGHGRVTLRGAVSSEREHALVVAAARSVGGDRVVDRLDDER